MKKTISILMIAMMILTSGALSAYALVEETAPGEAPVATDAVAEDSETATEAVTEEAAAEEEVVADVEAAAEAVEEEAAEVASEEAAFAAVTIDINITNNGKNVSWDAVQGATKYLVELSGKATRAYETTAPSIVFNDLDEGNYTITVEALDASNTLLGAGRETFTVDEYINAVPRMAVYSGYASVSVYWAPVADAEKYVVVYSTKEANMADFDNYSAYHLVVNKNMSIDSTIRQNGGLSTAKNFAVKGITKVAAPWDANAKVFKLRLNNTGYKTFFKVYAVRKGKGGKYVISDTAAQSYGQRVEYIKYKFTLKRSKKLTSHDGKNKTYTFKKGQTLTASGFGGGKFKFYYKIGTREYYFYCNAIDTKNCSAIYKKSGNYSRLAAENYVNEKGFRSNTGYLIWASLYCQHAYIFKGSRGHWECIRDFEIGSGAAKAASPSGEDKELIAGPGTEAKPGKKYSRSGHGRRYYWNPYSSWNSFHSVKMSKAGAPLQTLGYPASKGCIRCSLADAKYIYGMPRHTRVVVM
ncbi:MAG TPA: hypothetical protein DCZ71_08415 [Ruminococcus sp.]|nr:hypothetical protein [Ruminococcus sp.]